MYKTTESHRIASAKWAKNNPVVYAKLSNEQKKRRCESSKKWMEKNRDKARYSVRKSLSKYSASKRFFESCLVANEIGKLNEKKGNE